METTTKVVIWAEQREDNWPSNNLLKFRDWLNTQIDKITPEYRHRATIEIYGTPNHENTADVSIDIEYDEYETV